MDFRRNPEQEAFRDLVRRLAQKHLAPGARERAHATAAMSAQSPILR